LYTVKMHEGVVKDPDMMANLCIENVKNDTLKGWFLLSNKLLKAKTFDQDYQDKLDMYQKYILSDEQKSKLQSFLLTIKAFGSGEKGYNFEGTTTDNKKVSFNDFKGKVVLVDVWATWCGPCKKEIPSLQKLEEEMKGTDVVFISYSVDKMKDHDTWVKMVADLKLGGVQLMGDADFKSPICTNYKINSIPRFMVFDRKGQIVTIDAPRPSNPQLKILLEKLLKM
jgi:thiol-disulfide isomerase/thioredoxin